MILGPLRLILPLVSFAVTYPLMLKYHGLAVAGLWSLILNIGALVAASDVGFSQLLMRDGGEDQSPEVRRRVLQDLASAHLAYVFLAGISIFVILIAGALLPTTRPYTSTRVAIVACLTVVGAFVQLASRLEIAMLSARGENAVGIILSVLSSLLGFAIGVVAILTAYPLEGFAIGMCVSGGLQFLVARLRRLRTSHAVPGSEGAKGTMRDAFDFARRGVHFYSISLGFVVRIPAFSFIIAATLGLEAVAVFQLALRIVQTVRDSIAGGFEFLLPMFAFSRRSGRADDIVKVSRTTLLLVLPVGAMALGGIAAASPVVVTVWLGRQLPHVGEAIAILGTWSFVTLLNIPFWYGLQAIGQEKVAAYSIWAHTGAVLFLALPALALHLSLIAMLSYWTVTALVTQALIFYYAERRLNLVSAVAKDPRVRVSALASTLALLVLALVNTVVSTFAGLVVVIALVLIVLTALTFRPGMDSWKRFQTIHDATAG